MFAFGPNLYLTLKIEGPLHHVLPLVLLVIDLLLEDGPVPIKLRVKVIAKLQLFLLALVISEGELHLITWVFPEDVLAHADAEIEQMVRFVGTDVRDHELTALLFVPVVVGDADTRRLPLLGPHQKREGYLVH